MEHLKNANMVCLDMDELKLAYKNDKLEKLTLKMQATGCCLQELRNDHDKAREIIGGIVAEDLKHKEEREFFTALSFPAIFDQKCAKICFVLKDSFNFKKTPITSLKSLTEAIKESDLTDFAILYDDGGRSHFQLKQYTDKLETDSLFEFIKKTLIGYGNDMGDVNLLILLQGKDREMSHINFKELHERTNALKLSFNGTILVKYNEEDKFHVLNQVYPELGTTRIKVDPNFRAGEFLYN